MPGSMPPLDLSRQLADALKRIQRLERATAAPSGFDPNADPIIIGNGASAAGGFGCVSVGPNAAANGSDSFAFCENAIAQGTEDYAAGYQAQAGNDSSSGGNTATGRQSQAGATISGSQSNTSYGAFAKANGSFNSTAAGANARADNDNSTAVGAGAHATKDGQIMMGTSATFVEIPGNSSSAPNGLVLTDTATGTRYIVQITSGALVLSAAP